MNYDYNHDYYEDYEVQTFEDVSKLSYNILVNGSLIKSGEENF